MAGKRYPYNLVGIPLLLLVLCPVAYGAEIILHVPDDKVDWVLSEVFKRFGANGFRSPVYEKSESEKLAWCFQQVIDLCAYVGGPKMTLEQMESTVEVKR